MEVTEIAVEYLKDKGYNVKMVEFSDFNVPNSALQEGSVDYNFMQHEPYLMAWNESNNGDLVAVGDPVFSPLQGVFSFNITRIDEVSDNMEVVIPNDAANRLDSLKMLEKIGLIKLDDNVDPSQNIDTTHIVENPYNLQFIEVADYLKENYNNIVEIMFAHQ